MFFKMSWLWLLGVGSKLYSSGSWKSRYKELFLQSFSELTGTSDVRECNFPFLVLKTNKLTVASICRACSNLLYLDTYNMHPKAQKGSTCVSPLEVLNINERYSVTLAQSSVTDLQ